MSGRRDAGLLGGGSGDSHILTASELVTGFFRREYGRLVATLSRRVGLRYVEEIEDAAQFALTAALENWTTGQIPENPSGWVYRVALNHLMSELKQRASRDRLLRASVGDSALLEFQAEPAIDGSDEELLSLLFLCCDESIPSDSQVVFALKTLCGFDTREIAIRLFTSEANVYKRFSRARDQLRELWPVPQAMSNAIQNSRLASVHKTLYILFTEGYLSSSTETAIRRELCNEAIRLTTILADHPIGQTPQTFALLALMHLHSARLESRQSESGGLLLLEEQDRTLWDQASICTGLQWLGKSASGDTFSRYHAEAGIAAEHCLARSFESVRWDVVADCYEMLERCSPSPLHTLNRAVAVAERHGPKAGLAILEGLQPPSWLAGSYLWSAVLADLHRRDGNADLAVQYCDMAIESAPSPAIRELIRRRLHADSRCGPAIE